MEEHGDKAIKIEENKTIVEEINNENEILKNIEEGYEEKETKETRKSRREKAKESKRKATIAIMITLIICSLIIFSIIFALLNIKNTNILSGISILNIDVSEMSKEEALQKVNDIINEKLTSDITIKHGSYETVVNTSQFGIKFNIDKAVNKAYNIGKADNIVVNNYKILLTKLFKTNIEPELIIDEEVLQNKIKEISAKLPNAVVENSYYIEGKKLIIVRGKRGNKVESEKFKNILYAQIKDINKKENIIELPVQEADPEPINLEKIRKEIYKEPKDAYIEENPFKVYTHVNGVDFDMSMEEAEKIIEENKQEYEIPLKITIPKKTLADLGEKAFPDQLSTYTTRYNAGNYNRSNNLELAAKAINGTILMPGETFSYNQTVGERTISAGYKAAGAYAGGKVVQDVGGGICQISSTLYNAVLLANLEVTDRSNHCFETSYVAAGRDATVNWGTVDFQFKNNRNYPIKIETVAKDGITTAQIYGIKEKTEYEVIIQSKITSYIYRTTKYKNDATLEEGKEIVEESGFDGCNSETYKILKLNGKVISQTLVSRDTYDPMDRIVIRGTKKIAKPEVIVPVNSGEEEKDKPQETDINSEESDINQESVT